METKLIEKVETKKVVQNQKLLKVCGVILLIAAAINLFFGVGYGKYQDVGYWADLIFNIAAALFCLIASKRLSKNREQFIEWWTDKIVYKTNGDTEVHTITNDEIDLIKTGLDVIVITNKDKQMYEINITDFTDYKVRMQIKNNFENFESATFQSPAV